MATITPTITEVKAFGAYCNLVQWTPLTEADTCAAVNLGGAAGKSVQITGTFGSATIVLQGSNDGTNFKTLTDPQGNAISKTTADLEAIEEEVLYIKPSTSGGTGSSITVSLLVRRQK